MCRFMSTDLYSATAFHQRFLWWNLATRIQILDSALVRPYSFQDLIGAIFLVIGDVPVDSEVPLVTSSISRICWLSLSKMLIEIGLRACIHRSECASAFVSVCVCTLFRKKKHPSF